MSYGTSFDADFDAGTATIDNLKVDLTKVNTVLIDSVDRPEARVVAGTIWSEPRLPLAGDMNLVVVQRSRVLRDYPQCEMPMAKPA